MALPSSDVDISIIGFIGFDTINILKVVLENLQIMKWVKSTKPIFSAAIPIIKLVIRNI